MPGPVRSQGEGPPELVAGAQHAAIRLEYTQRGHIRVQPFWARCYLTAAAAQLSVIGSGSNGFGFGFGFGFGLELS